MSNSKPWEAKGIKGLKVGSVCSVYGAQDVTLNGQMVTVLDYDGTDYSNIARWFVKFQQNGTRLILPESCLNPTGQILNIQAQKSNMQWSNQSSSHNPPTNHQHRQYGGRQNQQQYVHNNDWVKQAQNNYNNNGGKVQKQNNYNQNHRNMNQQQTPSNNAYNTSWGNGQNNKFHDSHSQDHSNNSKPKKSKNKSCLLM